MKPWRGLFIKYSEKKILTLVKSARIGLVPKKKKVSI